MQTQAALLQGRVFSRIFVGGRRRTWPIVAGTVWPILAGRAWPIVAGTVWPILAGRAWPILAVPSVVPHVTSNSFLVGLRPRARPGARKGEGLLECIRTGKAWPHSEHTRAMAK